jgi:hypothetical protein
MTTLANPSAGASMTAAQTHRRNRSKRFGQFLHGSDDLDFLATLPSPVPDATAFDASAPTSSPELQKPVLGTSAARLDIDTSFDPLNASNSVPSLLSAGSSSPALSAGSSSAASSPALSDSGAALLATFPLPPAGVPAVRVLGDAPADDTLAEVRALGAFWAALSGAPGAVPALAADADPEDKYRSLLAALESHAPDADASAELSLDLGSAPIFSTPVRAADELPLPTWDVATAADTDADRSPALASIASSGCDAITRVLAELEASISSEASVLNELSQLSHLGAAPPSPDTSASPLLSRRGGSSPRPEDSSTPARTSTTHARRRVPTEEQSEPSGRSALELDFRSWVDVGALPVPPQHRLGPAKLVKRPHTARPLPSVSVPDLKAHARAMRRKTSHIFGASDKSAPALAAPATRVMPASRSSDASSSQGSRATHRSSPRAALSALPCSAPSPTSPLGVVDADVLETSSALDRLELSIAKLEVEAHEVSALLDGAPLSSPASRPADPPHRSPRKAAAPRSPRKLAAPVPAPLPARPRALAVRTKASLPALPWEQYDPTPSSGRSFELRPVPALPPCPALEASCSAPSALGLGPLALAVDPFALAVDPFASTPLVPVPMRALPRPSAAPTPQSAASPKTSPASSFVVIPPAIPPEWYLNEPPAPLSARTPTQSSPTKQRGGLLRKAVQKAREAGKFGIFHRSGKDERVD